MSRHVSTTIAATILGACAVVGCGDSTTTPTPTPDARALVSGVVTRNNGDPVEGARVQVSTRSTSVVVAESQRDGVLTDASGRYALEILATDYPLSYVSGTLAVGQTLRTGFFRDTVLQIVRFDLAQPTAVNTFDVVVDP